MRAHAARRSWSCTPRVEPKGTLLDPATYDDVVADVVAFLRERIASRSRRACAESS